MHPSDNLVISSEKSLFLPLYTHTTLAHVTSILSPPPLTSLPGLLVMHFQRVSNLTLKHKVNHAFTLLELTMAVRIQSELFTTANKSLDDQTLVLSQGTSPLTDI